VLHVAITELCERLRLMFFGSFREDWAEFVLSDLGIRRYENVPFDSAARAFQSREQIDHFYALYRLRELIHEDAPSEQVMAAIPAALSDRSWIETRRSKLLFVLGQKQERAGRLPEALNAYEESRLPEARVRCVRVLERLGRFSEAASMLGRIEESSASELETQHAARFAHGS
jgi:tetratricopeptide (TPR) repeat protein